jgi:hypothetical protein
LSWTGAKERSEVRIQPSGPDRLSKTASPKRMLTAQALTQLIFDRFGMGLNRPPAESARSAGLLNRGLGFEPRLAYHPFK